MKEQFEVTPEQAKEWREREQKRLADGTYVNLPINWLDSSWFFDNSKYSIMGPHGYYTYPPRYPDHFAHISVDKVSTIAFTENEQKGVRDRQTRMSPGRYLTRFFSEWLPPHAIRNLATQMGADYNDDAELCFAKTADEIEHIYKNGPSSCMDGRHPFASPVHPTRVYAGFDLELAYLKRNGGITARALVWPMRKIYGRLYGDSTRLARSLSDKGYKSGSLAGAKITKLMHDDAYVIPYLDYLSGAVDKGTHLVLADEDTRERDLCCDGDRQNGLSGDNFRCSNCGEPVDEENMYDGNVCRCCYTLDRWQCDRTGDWISDDEHATEVRASRRIQNGSNRYRTESWCQDAIERDAFYCDRDDVYYNSHNFTSTDVGDETWGPEAVARDAVMIDGVWHDKDDAPTEMSEPYGPHQLETAGVRTSEIVVGCLVTCISDVCSQYTLDKVYKVKRLSDSGYTNGTLWTEVDDMGCTSNGWGIDNFRFHSMPQQTGWHIRHEPEQNPVWSWRLYDGDTYVNGWMDEYHALANLNHRLTRHEATSATNNI